MIYWSKFLGTDQELTPQVMQTQTTMQAATMRWHRGEQSLTLSGGWGNLKIPSCRFCSLNFEASSHRACLEWDCTIRRTIRVKHVPWYQLLPYFPIISFLSNSFQNLTCSSRRWCYKRVAAGPAGVDSESAASGSPALAFASQNRSNFWRT